MKSISFSAVIILVIVAIAALAQEPDGSFRHATLPPNGYIGFSGLPAPPNFFASAMSSSKNR
ncbi:MAG TPA: hypothetical protein VMB49_07180 [Acidobacteriaceae bacterium]|nr:hypothetical protein [Acidobacteriaceae bacterium]